MDYIAGQNMIEIDLDANNDITKRLANIIAHLGGIKGGDVPGPVGGGMPEGYLFGDLGTRTVFNCVEDLNFWLNKRLTLIGKSIDLTPFPLALCHMDLCRRNLVLMEDQSIGLLDWGHAGFFPRVFDVAAIGAYNDKYRQELLKAVREVVVLEEDEILCIDLLMRARAGSLRFRL